MKITKQSLRHYFIDHNLLHYASSLSFHTILALIPVLLISFYLFTHLEAFTPYKQHIQEFIFNAIIPVQRDYIQSNINTFMQNAYKMGILGGVFVLYVSLMFFGDFEYVVNKIYGIAPRKFFHSISIYLTLLILMPVGVALSFFLTIKGNLLLQSFEYTHWLNLLSISSYLIMWLLFFIIYLISANTKVHAKSAAISSFVASLAWYASKMLFVYYVTFNKTYTSLYGSFSTIMFFLLWIYLSWIIFLYGVKLSFILNEMVKEKRKR